MHLDLAGVVCLLDGACLDDRLAKLQLGRR
jgi:hypothetical protein